MNIAQYLLEKRMQTLPSLVENISFLPVRRTLFKLIAIFMMETPSLFRVMVLILGVLVFIAGNLTFIKGLTLALC